MRSPGAHHGGRRRVGTAAAVAFATLLAVSSILLLITDWTSGSTDSPAVDPAPPSDAGVHGTDAARGGRTTAADAPPQPSQPVPIMPVTPPLGVTWRVFEGVLLPYSRDGGPTCGPDVVCDRFARSPEGALMAVAHLSVRPLLTPGEGWRQVTQRQVLAGPGRDSFEAARARVTSTTAGPGGFGQLTGFRFVTYRDDAAVVQLVTRFPSGALQLSTLTVRWVAGDWRLELQPTGGMTPTVVAVPDLTGFVAWGGV